MKKVLILGCNAITEFIVPRLTGLATISEIIIASRDKAECDELRKKYSGKGARITTARVDLDNEQGTKMMLSITNPDLIVNLAPAELSLKVMKLALEAGTDYIDGVLYDWENGNLLSKQFEHFAERFLHGMQRHMDAEGGIPVGNQRFNPFGRIRQIFRNGRVPG